MKKLIIAAIFCLICATPALAADRDLSGTYSIKANEGKLRGELVLKLYGGRYDVNLYVYDHHKGLIDPALCFVGKTKLEKNNANDGQLQAISVYDKDAQLNVTVIGRDAWVEPRLENNASEKAFVCGRDGNLGMLKNLEFVRY